MTKRKKKLSGGDICYNGNKANLIALPLARCMSLPGHTKKCCCGRSVGKEYYVLFATNIINPHMPPMILHVGKSCAEKMVGKPGQHGLPLFNPLAGELKFDLRRTKSSNKNSPAAMPVMNEVNKGVYYALNLLMARWEIDGTTIEPDGPLKEILETIQQNPAIRISKRLIKSANTIIKSAGNISKIIHYISNKIGKGIKSIELSEAKKAMDEILKSEQRCPADNSFN
jgi:hypothetical protein